MNVESGPQLDLKGAVRRRWKTATWTAGLTFLAVYWVSLTLPNEYESYATLLVEPQAVSDSLVTAGGEEIDLNNRLHLMTAQILARSRLSRIIDDLGLYEFESEYMLREEVIDLMRSNIAFVPILPALQEGITQRREEVEITTFQLWFKAHDAETAAEVAQRLADDFIKEHIAERVQQTQKSLEFIEAQLQRLSTRMQTVEQQIARVKDENPGRLPEVLFSNHRLLERAVGDERVGQQKLNEARSDVAFWTNQAKLSQLGDDKGSRNDDSSGVRQLRVLELELAELRSKGLTDKHPDVVKLRSELERVAETVERRKAEAELEAAALAAADEEELGEDVLYEEQADPDSRLAESYEQATAMGERDRAEMRVEAALAEIERLQENQYIIQNRIDATPRVAEQLDALERDYAQLHQSLNDFSHRRTEANVQANLERRQLGEKFRILEAAYPPIEVSWPNREVLIPMGLVFGLVLGAVVAVLTETLDSTFHSVSELQSIVKVPVLAAIPQIVLDSDLELAKLANRKARRLAILSVVVTLIGSSASYWYMNGIPSWMIPAEEEETGAEGTTDVSYYRPDISNGESRG